MISSKDPTDIALHKTRIIDMGKFVLPDVEYGDLKLSIFPFENTTERIPLPAGFELWEEAFNEIVQQVPLQDGANNHYVTIDTKFFHKDDFLRREGVHMDGNFCVDPNFRTWRDPKLFKNSWGGGRPKPGWSGARSTNAEAFVPQKDNSHVEMDWVLPYDITFPVGKYVSHNKGGLLVVSSEVGCKAWQGEFVGEVLSEGSYKDMQSQLTDDKAITFDKNRLYFMTSNTPHETLLIEKGKRRALLRITLDHNYNNEAIAKLKG